jgi:hypothetical protein
MGKFPRRLFMSGMIMLEQAMAVLEKVPDDKNVDHQHHGRGHGKFVNQFNDFDRRKKSRSAKSPVWAHAF